MLNWCSVSEINSQSVCEIWREYLHRYFTISLIWLRNAYTVNFGEFFCGFDPLNVVGYCWDLQKAHPWPETRVLAYRSSWSPRNANWALAAESKKREKEKKFRDVTSHIFAQTTHVVIIGARTNLKVGGGAQILKFFYSAPSLITGAPLSGGAQCMFGRAHLHCFVLKTGLQMKPL